MTGTVEFTPLPGTEFRVWFPTLGDRDDPLWDKVAEAVYAVADAVGIEVHIGSTTRPVDRPTEPSG